MKGNNTLTVCQEEMKQAIQHYLETKLFKAASCPTVESVSQTSGQDKSFEIRVKEDGYK